MEAGTAATFAIKKERRSDIRKGMVLLDAKLKPAVCSHFLSNLGGSGSADLVHGSVSNFLQSMRMDANGHFLGPATVTDQPAASLTDHMTSFAVNMLFHLAFF